MSDVWVLKLGVLSIIKLRSIFLLCSVLLEMNKQIISNLYRNFFNNSLIFFYSQRYLSSSKASKKFSNDGRLINATTQIKHNLGNVLFNRPGVAGAVLETAL